MSELKTFTRTDEKLPPKNKLIEWVSPGGLHVRGKWQGGAVWFPEGSSMYVYYTPLMWRLVGPND